MTIAPHRLQRASRSTPDERDLHIAWLLGLTPARVRTMRRVLAKCVAAGTDDPAAVAGRIGLRPKLYRCWRRLEELDDDALAAEVHHQQALGRHKRAGLPGSCP